MRLVVLEPLALRARQDQLAQEAPQERLDCQFLAPRATLVPRETSEPVEIVARPDRPEKLALRDPGLPHRLDLPERKATQALQARPEIEDLLVPLEPRV